MRKKAQKRVNTNNEPLKKPLGIAPAILARRKFVRKDVWCPSEPDVEFDSQCDPDNPVTMTFRRIKKAARALTKEMIQITPTMESHWSEGYNSKLYFKVETLNRTGSFHERGALYSLMKLSDQQKEGGVYTASLGNWAMALAYHGQKAGVDVSVVLPLGTSSVIVEKCKRFGAETIVKGKDFASAKRFAFTVFGNSKKSYINGYDNPNVIAASGTIGLEIMEELPEVDAILVPVGGGGLIAGIAAAAKHIKPEVLIYAVQPKICCAFFNAMHKGKPCETDVTSGAARSLAVSKVGYNAFHTAINLIDRMVLVEEDWITRAILHLFEEQKLVVEGAGAVSLSPFMAFPELIPELREKTVVCVVSGSNIDSTPLSMCLERAMMVEGRFIKMKVTVPVDDDTKTQAKVLRIIAVMGCNLHRYIVEHGWLMENDFHAVHLKLVVEATDIDKACSLKRVMQRLFPGMCRFHEEAFSPVPYCLCFPKRIY